jgi:hypothetical protein
MITEIKCGSGFFQRYNMLNGIVHLGVIKVSFLATDEIVSDIPPIKIVATPDKIGRVG